MQKALLPFSIFILAFVLLSMNNGGLMIYALDEAKNAGAAREMWEAGEGIVPTFNYELRTDKPPLHYYFMMASYQVFGVNAWSARLFSSIMGAFTVLLTFLFAAKFMGKKVGVFASLILLSSLHWNIQHHMAVPDPYLIFFFSAALFSFFTFYHSRQKVFLWLFYLSIGLATLAKGPVAIGLPGLIILIFLILQGKWKPREIFQFKPLIGGALVLLIALPWYLAVHFQTDGLWTQEFFFKHNVNRFTSPMEGHGGFFLMTPLMVLVGMLPFSIFIWQSSRMVFSTWKRPEINFLTITTLTIVGFFSISGTKLPNYPVPAYPALAILLAQYLSYAIEHNRISKIPQYILTSIGLALPWVLYFFLQKDPYFQHVAYVAFWLLPLNAGSLAALYFCKKGEIMRSVQAHIIAWVSTGIFFFAFAYPVMDRENPVAKILPKLDQSVDFYHYKRFNAAFSFYLAKPIPQLTEMTAIQEKMAGGKPFYLISRRSLEEEFNQLPQLQKVAEAKDVYETPFTVVYLFNP